MKTWVRRPDYESTSEDDVLIWLRTSPCVFYVILASGVTKLASIVGHEGMTEDWEPCSRAFLALKSAK